MTQLAKTSGADHKVMRDLNRSLVLDMIKESGPISRATIAKATTLAKPTVSAIVDDLISDSLVRTVGTGEIGSAGGRPPILLEFNARSSFLAGVHVGVQRISVMVADASGAAVGRLSARTPKGRRPAETLRRAASLIREAFAVAEADSSRLAAVGVCIPGLVDFSTGQCFLAPNLNWSDVAVGSILEAELSVPVFVHNVSQASAVAESIEGAGQGASDFLLLYVGSGIGVGILRGGRVFHGADGISGEVGHCPIPGATERCNCGRIGCLETVAASPAIERTVRAALDAGRPSVLASSRGKHVDVEAVVAAAHAGDELAVEVLAEAGAHLGLAATWLVNLFNPRSLVLGGDLAAAGELLLGPMRAVLSEHAQPRSTETLSLGVSILGQDAEVRGAVLLARQGSDSYYRVIFQA